MQTSLQIDGANCPTCFNETLEAIAALEGVRRVHGSIAGPCIEIDHDVPMETITAAIRTHLHGACVHHRAEAPNPAAGDAGPGR